MLQQCERFLYPQFYLHPNKLLAICFQKIVGRNTYIHQRAEYMNRRLKSKYSTCEYPNHIVQFRSSAFAAKSSKAGHDGWRKVCGGRLTSYVIEGDHDPLFLYHQWQANFSAAIRRLNVLGDTPKLQTTLKNFRQQTYCRGLYQLSAAA